MTPLRATAHNTITENEGGSTPSKSLQKMVSKVAFTNSAKCSCGLIVGGGGCLLNSNVCIIPLFFLRTVRVGETII